VFDELGCLRPNAKPCLIRGHQVPPSVLAYLDPSHFHTSMALPKLPTPGKTITSAESISSGLNGKHEKMLNARSGTKRWMHGGRTHVLMSRTW